MIFTATPQGYLAGVLDDEILSQAKVIDLSADYRIKDVAVYENGTASHIKALSIWMRLYTDCVS